MVREFGIIVKLRHIQDTNYKTCCFILSLKGSELWFVCFFQNIIGLAVHFVQALWSQNHIQAQKHLLLLMRDNFSFFI